MFVEARTIHRAFELQAQRTPRREAVSCGDEALAYDELNACANRLAHRLIRSAVTREARVGISLPRSVDWLVAVLGILKSGAAYLPLDPGWPCARRDRICEDAAAAIVVTPAFIAEALSDASLPDTNPELEIDPSSLAYVIYTSGSTGAPKGVMVEHASVMNLVASLGETIYTELPAGPLRIGVNGSLVFDTSVKQIVQVCAGHTLAILPDHARLDVDALRAFLAATPLDVVDCTPTQLSAWYAGGIFATPETAPAAVLVAGEAIGQGLWDRLLATRHTAFFNLYGPTECTVDAVACRVTPERPTPRLGRALPRIPVLIAGEELCIGGIAVARGYLNSPRATAERFVPDPHGPAGARLYRTGDRVRELPDGEIAFVDRIDRQLKISGFRVEPGEIEATLMRHPAVRDAAVAVRESARGEAQLVAYVVAARTPVDLKSYLKAQLPAYMQPRVVWLAALPMTANGKVDRAALPDPSAIRSSDAAPTTAVERALAAIWSEVLGHASISIDDDFFDLGGHSLIVAQVAARIRERLGVEVTLERLFAATTVAALAREVESARALPSAFPCIRPAARQDPLPLSFAQERVWFVQRLAPDNVAYLFRTIIRFRGRLDVVALERALTEIVRRHEIFRTTFPEVDGRPSQVVHAPWHVALPVVDLSGEGARGVARLNEICAAAFRVPFDLGKLPLARWTLVKLHDGEHALVQAEHHVIHDGWSFNVFLDELRQIYSAYVEERPSPLSPLPIQFADFCLWQRQWAATTAAHDQLSYWKRRLRGAPPSIELPFDRPRGAVQTFTGAIERVELPPPLADALRDLSRREQVTLFMTMHAAFALLLHRYTGQQDLCIGSGMANRRRREAEGLIGMVINTVVLRTQIEPEITFRELLHRVRETALGAYENQDVPFDRIVDAVQPRRDVSHNPLFQVAFSFHDAPLVALDIPGGTMEPEDLLDNGSAKFDLGLIVIPRAEQQVARAERTGATGITMIWEYDTELFDAATVRRMAARYVRVLETIAQSSDSRVSDVPLLDEKDRWQLAEWNATAAEYPGACVHDLFRACVRQEPDAIAVLDGKGQLTYAALAARSEAVARALRARGVGRGDVVAVCMERGTALVAALLGVLQAGAAYLPLDDESPEQRWAFIVRDAGAALVIVDERTEGAFAAVGIATVHAERDLTASRVADALPASHLDDPAYVIFTSGSTGRPKGVVVSHRSLTNVLTAVRRSLGATSADRVCALSNVVFDIAALELFMPLVIGGSCWVGARKIAATGDLPRELAASGATIVQATPSGWRMLLDQGWKSHRRIVQLAAGEPLSPALAEALLRNGPLWNLYGPTETAVYATLHEVVVGERIIPIGRPVANAQAFVLDEHLRPAPIGVFGELYIAGTGVALGYLNRPSLTAASFVPNPFAGGAGSRMYRTGDRARFRADGTLEFGGRRDGQVKLRGFRVETGEVESVLRTHAGVRDAAVVARDDGDGNMRLVAYVVRNDVLGEADLRLFLKRQLPAYMIPATVVWLEALPLTASGKLDRHALPHPAPASASSGRAAPMSAMEQELASIWTRVLGRPPDGSHDNFFDLGGHSLAALKLTSLVRNRLQVDLPVRVVFDSPVLADMAAAIDNLKGVAHV